MIWVIAGTLDGRTLAVDIQERTGEEVLVTVVSQYGAELAAHEGKIGRASCRERV